MDILAQLQADFAARLNSLAYFSTIEVISLSAFPTGGRTKPESVEALLDRIQQSLAGLNEKNGKVGACIVVPLPNLDGRYPNVPGPQVRLRLSVQILINPILNEGATGTQKALSEIALNVIQAGHHFQLQNVAGLTAGDDAFSPGVDEEKGLLVGVVTFESLLQLDQPSSVAIPVASVASTVTLTCSTAGAAIYYTVDGTLPWSGNAGALLYSAPFATPSAGTIVRAAAYKTGSNGSNVLWREI